MVDRAFGEFSRGDAEVAEGIGESLGPGNRIACLIKVSAISASPRDTWFLRVRDGLSLFLIHAISVHQCPSVVPSHGSSSLYSQMLP